MDEVTILSLLDAEVTARPDANAIDMDGALLSYRALDRWAGAVKAALAGAGVEPGDRVAIDVASQQGMVAAILGILKAGAAYVPVARGAAPARRGFIIADSKSRVVIDDAWLARRGLSEVPRIAPPSPAEQVSPDDIACLLYGSGSEEQPTGSAITHRHAGWLMTRSHFPSVDAAAVIPVILLTASGKLEREALAAPDDTASAVPIVDAEERARRLGEFNATDADFPASRTVVDLFEDVMRRCPDQPAVIIGERRRSYREIDDLASRIAGHLTVAPDEAVGIVCASGEWSIPGILGILKAGAAFLPMDVRWPVERIRQLVSDAGCRFVLVASEMVPTLDLGAGVTIVDVARAAQTAAQGIRSVRSAPAALACVIYGSESTGQLRGVAVEHRSLMNYVTWAAREYAGSDAVNWPLVTSLPFDLTLTSLLVPLTTGRSVVVYDGDMAEVLDRILGEGRVSAVKLTAAHLPLIRDRHNAGSAVRRLIVVGEQLESQLCRDAIASFEHPLEIHREYGSTEVTVGCMLHRFDAARDVRELVPLGRPAANTHIYLFDADGQPVPDGVPGEICVGGAGLAREYLHQPDVTATKFVSYPAANGERLYRTGDTGRWLPDGALELIRKVAR